MNIGEICNREVIIVQRRATASDAARLMRSYHVGDLVVVEERRGVNMPVGILTDRDLVLEVLAQEVDPNAVYVGDLMNGELITASEQEDADDALHLMRSRGIRRLPVVDAAGALIGIITVDDLLEYLGEQVGEVARLVARGQQHERRQRS